MSQGGHLDQFLARDPTFPGELWTWFCIGTTVMILRFGVRLRMAGIAGLAADDYFMVLVSDHDVPACCCLSLFPPPRHVWMLTARCRHRLLFSTRP